jgi:SAM-dependent methyltransferase
VNDTEAFWEDLYTTRADGDRIWSGHVNALLDETVASLSADAPPGRALDLGCGEGGDAVHLATAGWQVTAVDVSPTALARTTELAASAGVSERVTTERHDLSATFPAGRFDLVVAAFFQTPLDLDRGDVMRRATDALEVGGHLVVVEHGSAPSWSEHQRVEFLSPSALWESFGLDPGRFTPLAVESREREATSPDGQHTGTLLDTLVLVRRTT